ncbi:PKD repeats containing protein [Halanaeroarchaeum sp. HSR-CO]|uniref:hypothetical protein n=1 Tax=Halanaeroarchaeum sp. HSR-CO TaxID=2866382 RepID=UPI00217D6503|nr:hypothetical protein [Halanaeroarchaeum sp. HSR-CO]UWG48185.1 PKD repeats containing protein [Halanaeroarchaeum sp. HSR-CO]
MMNHKQIHTIVVISLVVLSAIGGPLLASPVAAQQDQLSINPGVPAETTVGESTTISPSISTPDLVGSVETDLTVSLLIDGEQVSSETVTVGTGEEIGVDFTHTFESAGENDVEIAAEVEFGGQTFSNSASAPIDVQEVEDTASSSVQTTTTGAAFAIPASLEDDIEEYRQQIPGEVAPHAFVLATEDDLYIVFTEDDPRKGLATVTGQSVNQEMSFNGLSFSAILAQSVSIETDGSPATVGEIASNSDSYSLDLVEVTANHRKISTLTDTDQGEEITAVTSIGVLSDDPTSAQDLFEKPGEQARSFVVNTSSSDTSQSGQEAATKLLEQDSERVYTANFETTYWSDAPATINAIVLSPNSEAREFINTVDQSGIAQSSNGHPLLYVVTDEMDSTQYSDIQSVKQDASDGDVVSVEASLYGESISIQETLEHSTPCGQTQAQIPTPSGPVCLNIVQDTVVDTGVAWSSTPESSDDVLLVTGLSSTHYDEPNTPQQGEYRLVGEVVSTNRVDGDLPEGKILVVYELERTGDLEFDQLSEQSQGMVSDQMAELRDSMRKQILAGGVEEAQETADGQTEEEQTDNEQTTEETVDSPEDESGGFVSGILDGLSGVVDRIMKLF